MKPQDVVVLTKIMASDVWNQKQLSAELGISQSEISESLSRSRYSGMIEEDSNTINSIAFYEFLVYGLKYAFPVKPQGIAKGVLTAQSSPFMGEKASQEAFVWPAKDGQDRGQTIAPLYRSVPEAVEKDKRLYEYLSLIETLRVGGAKDRFFAIKRLKEIFEYI